MAVAQRAARFWLRSHVGDVVQLGFGDVELGQRDRGRLVRDPEGFRLGFGDFVDVVAECADRERDEFAF